MDTLARIMLLGTVLWYVSALISFIVPPFRREVTPTGIMLGFVFAFAWQLILAFFHWGGYA